MVVNGDFMISVVATHQHHQTQSRMDPKLPSYSLCCRKGLGAPDPPASRSQELALQVCTSRPCLCRVRVKGRADSWLGKHSADGLRTQPSNLKAFTGHNRVLFQQFSSREMHQVTFEVILLNVLIKIQKFRPCSGLTSDLFCVVDLNLCLIVTLSFIWHFFLIKLCSGICIKQMILILPFESKVIHLIQEYFIYFLFWEHKHIFVLQSTKQVHFLMLVTFLF